MLLLPNLSRTENSQPAIWYLLLPTHNLLSLLGPSPRLHVQTPPNTMATLTRAPQPPSVPGAVPSLQSAPQRSLHRAYHQGLLPWSRPRPRHLPPGATGCACHLLPHNRKSTRKKQRNRSEFQLVSNDLVWMMMHNHHTTVQNVVIYKKDSRQILAWV